MANPARKKGYTALAHEFWEALLGFDLTLYEHKTFELLLRVTWGVAAPGKPKGHQLDRAPFSPSWAAEKLHINERDVRRSLDSLEARAMAICFEKGKGPRKPPVWGPEQDYEIWLPATALEAGVIHPGKAGGITPGKISPRRGESPRVLGVNHPGTEAPNPGGITPGSSGIPYGEPNCRQSGVNHPGEDPGYAGGITPASLYKAKTREEKETPLPPTGVDEGTFDDDSRAQRMLQQVSPAGLGATALRKLRFFLDNPDPSPVKLAALQSGVDQIRTELQSPGHRLFSPATIALDRAGAELVRLRSGGVSSTGTPVVKDQAYWDRYTYDEAADV